MEEHCKLTDQDLEQQFIKCTLSPEVFSHEAHLRLAWLYLHKYGIDQAKELFQNRLKQYVTSLGAQDKYHTTLTVAAIKVVHHFMSRSKSDNFQDFITEFPHLKTNFKQLIASHYGYDIYSYEKARKGYVAPDLLPFDD